MSKYYKLFRATAVRSSLLFAIALALPVAAHADSLTEALRNAYRSNPDLQAQRAGQRATDELMPAAKSGWRPTVTTQASATQVWTDNDKVESSHNFSKSLNIQLSQPIFRGFKTVEGIKQAKSNILAGRQNLLSTEQNVLFQAITAYASVIRFRQLLALSQTNVSNLSKQAQAAKARFDVGEVTRTDVSQAQARVSGAKSTVASNKASLEAAIANYEQVIGNEPGKLASPKIARVPKTLQQALDIAQETNPAILAAAYVHDASLHGVEIAKGDLLPSASIVAQGTYNFDPAEGLEHSESASVQGVVNVPLYQSGREYAAVRQAKQVASQRQIQIISATRQVREQVRSSWYSLISSRQAIVAAQAQVGAAAQALDGVKQEYVVGSRSTIDVLNAEQELVSAKNALVNAQYSELVASYQVLASIGQLTAQKLALGGPYYDPGVNYHNTKNKWIGLDVDTVE